MSVFEMGKVRNVVEIAKMGVNHSHDDYRIERNVHAEPLRVLVPEFYESIQGQSFLIAFFGR